MAFDNLSVRFPEPPSNRHFLDEQPYNEQSNSYQTMVISKLYSFAEKALALCIVKHTLMKNAR